MANLEAKTRIDALKELLGQGKLSTQDELREELESRRFAVTQSTISRDLRRIGAVKAVDPDGRTVYRLSSEQTVPVSKNSLRDLILDMKSNGTIIVIHTIPGTASMVALHLDRMKPGGILGTIAGEDTIFVAPGSIKAMRGTMDAIEKSFEVAS
jgi:transcriptional regulator of arginine metabolism